MGKKGILPSWIVNERQTLSGFAKPGMFGRVLIYVFSFLIISGASIYMTCWESRMDSLQTLRSGLEEQDGERWLQAFWQEPKCFPVREPDSQKAGTGLIYDRASPEQTAWSFEDGYGEGRSYGGKRRHEGIDIMSSSGKRGELIVQSVSDGVVEQLGWLELGGYRIGVRSPSGLYYYYAHLDSYEKGLKKGDKIHAGQALGRMGDSGYGTEGTRGKFAVHLHFGIYYDDGTEEKSLNPYLLLCILQKKRRF